MTNGFVRVAAVSSKVKVADVAENFKYICEAIDTLECKHVDIAVFPELCVTGYTCGDLFRSTDLINAANQVVDALQKYLSGKHLAVIVGFPAIENDTLYNCAAYLSASKRVVVKKSYLPDYNEFYEKRRFKAGSSAVQPTVIAADCGINIAVEICEDLWAPVAPSTLSALAGAEVIFNLSASNDILYKYDALINLVTSHSQRCCCGYVYASSGVGESTTDVVFLPKQIIAECGTVIAENNRYEIVNETTFTISDIDMDAIRAVRLNTNTFADCASNHDIESQIYDAPHDDFDYELPLEYRKLSKLPFVPQGKDAYRHLDEIVSMQTSALLKRLSVLPHHGIVVGISGGLDSTLALMIAVNTYKVAGYPLSDITAITMPGFGTSGRTYNNALRLMELLGVDMQEISIKDAVLQHFKDIKHNPEDIDVTYENAQARERTQILMDVANQQNAIVLGTGDLSELALGWCTYNGDHMSMYGINSGVPKTLIRAIVARIADGFEKESPEIAAILRDIVATPISPELKPTDKHGDIAQITENSVGPYELQDFFLYYWLKYCYSLEKIFYLATQAFSDTYSKAEILKWLRVFIRRFFTQQFKRSCIPDGPKVTQVSLSPRGDWRMPSDACMNLWISQLNNIESKL